MRDFLMSDFFSNRSFIIPACLIPDFLIRVCFKQLFILTRNTIKDPHRYVVQESDTTMMTGAASLPGQ